MSNNIKHMDVRLKYTCMFHEHSEPFIYTSVTNKDDTLYVNRVIWIYKLLIDKWTQTDWLFKSRT